MNIFGFFPNLALVEFALGLVGSINEFSLFAGMKDEDGWFTLEYLNSGLFLTARPGDENPIIKKNCFPTCPGNF